MAVTDDAVAKIRSLIIGGDLQPGDRLPQESVLAQQLGLSRNSLREAVRVLEQMRVLNVRHGSGTYVADLQPEQLLEGIAFAVELMRDDTLREVVEVRCLLEPAATRLAVQRMTPSKLEEIKEAFDRNAAQTDIEALVQTDVEFHAAIARAADNQTLTTLLAGLTNRTVRLRIWGGIIGADAVALTVEHHRNILQAIIDQDSHAAEAAALVHVTHARRWLDAYLQTHPNQQRSESNGRPAPVSV